MTDKRKLREVFLSEYEATGRDLDAALKAVVLAVKAQEDSPQDRRRPPIDVVRRAVLNKYATPAAAQVVVEAAREFTVEPEHMPCAWAWRSVPHRSARWVAWRVLHDRPFGLSLPECAWALGMRNHTSVLRALRELDKDPALLAAVARVRQRLGLCIVPAPVNCQRRGPAEEFPSNSQPSAFAPQRPSTVSTLASEEAA
jgi:chromosomal replication initiation ATPase DnaA